MTRSKAIRFARGADKFSAPASEFLAACDMLAQGTCWDALAVQAERESLLLAAMIRGAKFREEVEKIRRTERKAA